MNVATTLPLIVARGVSKSRMEATFERRATTRNAVVAPIVGAHTPPGDVLAA